MISACRLPSKHYVMAQLRLVAKTLMKQYSGEGRMRSSCRLAYCVQGRILSTSGGAIAPDLGSG
jgi:hypothetical protein